MTIWLLIMVNGSHHPIASGKYPASAGIGAEGRAHASLVNRGQDTKITLSDGSIILMKGVRQVDAAFFTSDPPANSTLPPMREKIRHDC